jgi:peptidoglycan/xylan/chitin deacetylase (PgdA/CDA1 family)
MLAEAAGATACGVAFMAWAVRGKSSSVFGPSVWRGPRDHKAMALTFDDGPCDATPYVLELLDRFGAKATFFQCGRLAEKWPGVARQAVEAGHEIGNHSYSHSRMDFRPAGFIHQDLYEAQRAIREAAGVEPRLLRAPYGVRWFGMRAAQRRLNLLGVMWSCLGRDWRLTAPMVARRLLKGAGNGAIICLHDGRFGQDKPDIRATTEALAVVLPIWSDQGYRMVTVSQLIRREA